MAKPVDLVERQSVRKASSLRVLKTVFWSFFGVRRRSDNQDDFAGITPVQIIVAGVIGAVVLVSTLIMLVRFIAK
ncbi:MAG: DUF2970 domain-containing protein [Prolixibacteraceae bacterium]|nr:DUF2970 domain-containing protein [Burkholderiales bacterium]